MYYPCSENKGADQLHGHREANLRLCFRICKKPVFSKRGSYVTVQERKVLLYVEPNMNVLLILLSVSIVHDSRCGCCKNMLKQLKQTY